MKDEFLALRTDLQAALDRVDVLIEQSSRAGTDRAEPDLTQVARTVAIEWILQAHVGPMRPIEIWSALRSAGRSDPKMEVQVTTFDLWERGRIGKVGRGQYVAESDATRSSQQR